MARTSGSFSDITGPKIRDVALRLFARHGYAAVSMRQIAGEVGVQAGALYNYIPDKQSLLFDLLKGHMDGLLAERMANRRAGPAVRQLEDFTRIHIRFHLERKDAVFISYMELRNLTPENFEHIETLRRTYETDLQSILEAGQANGEFSVSDAKVSALAIIAMLTGLNTWYREDGRLTLNEVEEIYWQMVQNLVASGR